MPGPRQNLNVGKTVTLDANGDGQATLGPTNPPNWHVTSVITRTDRPGQAPVPRIELYLDTISPANTLAISYDGSYGVASGDQNLGRGQQIIAVWTGGQAGDVASLTVSGEKWS